MKYFSTLIISSLLSLLALPALQAEKLVIALGNFEPLFADQNEPALFKDLIVGVYSYLPNIDVTYRYMFSNSRLVAALNNGTVDGSANIFSAQEISGCVTQPIFGYIDIAISRTDKHHQINTIADLQNLSIVSYQGATTLLGDKFQQTVTHNQYYQEVAKPKEQTKLLAEGMVDVSIGDKYIFLHTLQTWLNESADNNKFTFHHIFPPVYSAMGFNSQQHCDAFDAALIKFKASGDYEEIYQQHLQRLGYNLTINH